MSNLCPSCAAALTGAASCEACGLSLSGPAAARLWWVDQRIAALDTELGALRPEREHLLTVLRSGAAPAPAPAAPAWTPPPPREANPAQVQNTLLGLGALLLVGAGLVFAAVTYNALGVTGRALILLAITALAAGGTSVLVKRGLTASGEAVSAVALFLAVVDTWAIRRAGLGRDIDSQGYDAIASGVLAVLTAGWAALLPLRSTRVALVIFAQGPVLFGLAYADPSAAGAAAVLSLLAAADVALAFVPQLPKEVRVGATAFAAAWSVATLGAVAGAFSEHDELGAIGLLVLAAVAAALATQVKAPARDLLSASVPILLGAAAWGATEQSLTGAQQPLIAVAVALIALQATALLKRTDRNGSTAGALVVAGAGLLAELPSVVQALAGPFTWLEHPWTLTASTARRAISVDTPWDGTVVTLIVLASAAACAVAAGLVLERVEVAAVPAGILLVLTALVLPLGLATSYRVALVLTLLVAVALAAIGMLIVPRQREAGVALAVTGIAASLVAAVWSTADQTSTLTALPVVAVLAAALSLRVPGVLTGLALVLGGTELAAVGASHDLHVDQVGGLLLAAPLVAVALSFLLKGLHRWGSEGAAVVLAATSAVLAVDDPGWLSWSLAGSGLLCLVVAAQKDRRYVALAGGLLLSASSWVRLADAHVTAPEPYVAPLAAFALVAGYLRRRSHPDMGSFEAFGAGLALALVPSLLKAFDDEDPTRGLILLVVASGVVLAGVPQRLRAALTIGGGVVVLDAFSLIAPYASALPRWALLAGAGALLVGVGATYEQRLKDVNRLRQSYERWS